VIQLLFLGLTRFENQTQTFDFDGDEIYGEMREGNANDRLLKEINSLSSTSFEKCQESDENNYNFD
jgi:hypothetical protein